MDTLHKILQLMWDKGISDMELCRSAGINKSAVTDWKKGKTQSYMKHLPEIAKVLDVTVDYLLDKKEKPTAENDGEREELLKLLGKMFTNLSEEQKETVLRYAEFLEKNQ